MNTRRITLALGAGGGGMLAAAFLPMAVAFAAPSTDTITDVVSPTNPEAVFAVTGIPPLYQQVEGSQVFNIDDVTAQGTSKTPDVLGSFTADQSVTTTPFGLTNTEELVTQVGTIANPANGTLPTTDVPTVGSTFDTLTFDGYTNHYSDIVTAAATAGGNPTDSITDTLTLPSYLGGGTVDLTPYIGGFDASQGLSTDVFGPATLDNATFLGDVDSFITGVGTLDPALGTDLSAIATDIATAFGF